MPCAGPDGMKSVVSQKIFDLTFALLINIKQLIQTVQRHISLTTFEHTKSNNNNKIGRGCQKPSQDNGGRSALKKLKLKTYHC